METSAPTEMQTRPMLPARQKKERQTREVVVVFTDKHYKKKNIRSLRKLVEFVDQRHSRISIGMLLLRLAMETVSVAFYVWTSEISMNTNLYTFRWPLPVFIVEVALSIVFFLEWVAIFFFETDKKYYLFSFITLVNLLTSVPMIIIGIGAIADWRWRHGWVPMFFRVWCMRDSFVLLLDYPQISRYFIDVYREFARFFALFIAVFFSCIGVHQIIEICRGFTIDIYTTLYMMTVGFGTIGYGDYSSKTTVGRVFMMFFLFIGVCFFLPLLYGLGKIAATHQFYRTYRSSKKTNHVIICGEFTDMAVEVLLRNFYAGWRKYLDTEIVFMTYKDHSAEMKLLANLSWLKGRVTLLVGDPQNPIDLQRAGAKRADAIFLFGNSRSAAYYNDYRLIAESLAIGLFDPELPQHLMLRRGRTAKQIAPYAASALEIERTMHLLLGSSLVFPGIVPFIINLIRTYEPIYVESSLSRHWVEQYEYSIRNDLYCINVPDALRGREFRILAREFYESDVTLIGVVDARNRVQLNPRELIANSLKLIMIAKTLQVAESVTDTIAHNYEVTFGEEMLDAPDPDEYFRQKEIILRAAAGVSKSSTTMDFEDTYQGDMYSRRSRPSSPTSTTKKIPRVASFVGKTTEMSMLQEGMSPLSPLYGRPNKKDLQSETAFTSDGDEEDEEYDDLFGNANGRTRKPVAEVPPRKVFIEIDNAFNFENHYIVIDLAPAKAKENETRYAHENTLTAVAHDIYHVLVPIRQSHPDKNIVLLTNDMTFAPYFEPLWLLKENTNSVHFINGCGLNTAELMRCNLEMCAGCCIFFSGDVSRFGSTSAMAMLVTLSIQDILQGPPPFPVVVELEGLANLSLFPPYAEDERLRTKAEIDFVFEPNFVIGNALSRTMLYPALQRTYFTAEFIDVMSALILGRSADIPSISWMALSSTDVEMTTYKDVVAFCLKLGILPIALHRCINDVQNTAIDGHRFVFTNPPRGLPVHQDTDAIFYITPSL